MDELQEKLTALMAAYEANDVAQTKKLQSQAMSCVSQQPSLARQRFYHLHEVRRKCDCYQCGYCEYFPSCLEDDDDLDEKDIEELQAERKDFFSYPVLWFFVKTQASIGIIKRIYKYHPQAASFRDGICLLAACQTGGILMDNEAMFFLLKAYPKALTSNNNSYRPWSPISDIVWADQDMTGKRFEVDAIKAIIAGNPEMHEDRLSFNVWGNYWGSVYPLSRALEEDDACFYPLMEFLTDNFPKDIKEFRVGFQENGDFRTTVPRVGSFGQYSASCLARILPQLKKLQFKPKNLTRDGLLGLIDHIPAVTLLVELDLCLRRHILDTENALATIKSVLERATTIETLCFSLKQMSRGDEEPEHHDDDFYFEAITESIGKMKSLTKCSLSFFSLASNKGLAGFLAKAPKRLLVENIGLRGDDGVPDLIGQTARLEYITLADLSFQDNTLRRLLRRLSKFPTLEKIQLRPFNYVRMRQLDISDALIDLLEHKKLTEIDFQFPFQLACAQRVCRSLKENRSLKVFSANEFFKDECDTQCFLDVVANHNTTLESIAYDTVPEGMAPQILYWLRLNKQGRRQVREDQNLSFPDFVELIVGAISPEGRSYYEKGPVVFNSQFGLLRERPSLWCNALENKLSSPRITRKKRKRDDKA